MHFRLDASVLNFDFQNDIDALSAIENILNADFSGSHLVSADRTVLRELLKVEGLSYRSYEVLKKIFNWLPMNGSAYKRIQHVVSIEADLVDIDKLSNALWKAPLKAFSNFVPTPSVLMSENLMDCHAYTIAAQHYINNKKLHSFTLRLKKDGGGGSTTPDRLNEIVSNKSDICICITDSDRLCPDAPPQSTCAKCEVIGNKKDWLVKHVGTSSRELENVIPLDAYKHCGIESINKSVSELKSVVDSTDPSIWNYVDLKNGVSMKWLLSHSETSPTFKYWSAIFLRIGLDEQPDKCFKFHNCELKLGKDDELCPECFVIPGVAKRMAEHAVNWLSDDKKNSRFGMLAESSMDEWLDIGRQVFEICCAPAKLRA